MERQKQKLWTYDFTVITVGSIVSLVGGALSGFGICLLVLDNTDSTFLYTLSIVAYQVPMLICPILAGTYLDRMSRKRVIYTLDFISSVMFLSLYLLLRGGWFSYPAMLLVCIAQGTIDSVYVVAYSSFYPNLIAEENYRRAYSVSSMLQPIAAMMTPVAAAFYDAAGSVAPIFALNAVCFFTAACFERTIRHQETHMASAKPADGLGAFRRFQSDFRDGIAYICGERGLLIICLFYMCSSFANRADNLQLPFFRNHPELFAALPVAAVTLYAIVSNCGVIGRVVGGLIHYLISVPRKYKTMVVLGTSAAMCVLSGTALFLPVPLMIAAFFLNGILGVTSATVGTAAMQAYVPDGKRARFNGTYQMLSALGAVAGSLTIGVLGEYLPERAIILGLNILGLALVYLFLYRNRKDIARIYNQRF